ncbi:hypothetical protein [Cellulomonas denverensis]|uniref:Uncharacterized protein n=1 Tax=Cellulomonas denverensis TaxID=264297 RepID=A0A7X6KUG3_9CELL|nr:hypothetical protein [Cellulomonas denverensis]NKY22204.1 hypothetical protein [Cellulomonas denverensis]GIG27168.1 hypothetical protein Cde04nite_34120 [Cellulomonas denverensis]
MSEFNGDPWARAIDAARRIENIQAYFGQWSRLMVRNERLRQAEECQLWRAADRALRQVYGDPR